VLQVLSMMMLLVVVAMMIALRLFTSAIFSQTSSATPVTLISAAMST
jgi:hypothetical protein